MKTRQNARDTPLCDTISKRYCAIWGVSLIGPLRRYTTRLKTEMPSSWYESSESKCRLCVVMFRRASSAGKITPDIPQSEIAATNFYDRATVWAKNWAKFWMIISGHFRASRAVQKHPSKFLPKFLPIYHSKSCHGSCGWNLKISSPHLPVNKKLVHLLLVSPACADWNWLKLTKID